MCPKIKSRKKPEIPKASKNSKTAKLPAVLPAPIPEPLFATIGGNWCHAQCAIFNPDITFGVKRGNVVVESTGLIDTGNLNQVATKTSIFF